MAELQKPLPKVDNDSSAFWQGASRGQLVLPKCEDCGRTHYYPRAICPYCHSLKLKPTPLSGNGRIYSYTVQRQPAGAEFAEDVPYVVALVDLDEGPRMLARIQVDSPDRVAIGQRVRVTFAEAGDEMKFPFFKVQP